METSLLELIQLVPSIGIAVAVALFLLKQGAAWQEYLKESNANWQEYLKESDALWRKAFEEATCEYKVLAERLEAVIIAATEAMSRQATTEELKREFSARLRDFKKEIKAEA